jgi:hypothetical protein
MASTSRLRTCLAELRSVAIGRGRRGMDICGGCHGMAHRTPGSQGVVLPVRWRLAISLGIGVVKPGLRRPRTFFRVAWRRVAGAPCQRPEEARMGENAGRPPEGVFTRIVDGMGRCDCRVGSSRGERTASGTTDDDAFWHASIVALQIENDMIYSKGSVTVDTARGCRVLDGNERRTASSRDVVSRDARNEGCRHAVPAFPAVLGLFPRFAGVRGTASRAIRHPGTLSADSPDIADARALPFPGSPGHPPSLSGCPLCPRLPRLRRCRSEGREKNGPRPLRQGPTRVVDPTLKRGAIRRRGSDSSALSAVRSVPPCAPCASRHGDGRGVSGDAAAAPRLAACATHLPGTCKERRASPFGRNRGKSRLRHAALWRSSLPSNQYIHSGEPAVNPTAKS